MTGEEKLKQNLHFLFKSQLAFEDYEDATAIQVPLIRKINVVQDKFRKERNFLSIAEQVRITNEIVEKYNKAFDSVGRDNFIFYDDGDINYIMKVEKNNG